MLEIIAYDKDEAPIKGANFFGSSKITLDNVASSIVDDKLRKAAEQFLYKYNKELNCSPASVSKHHWWTGGLRDHIEQVINIAVDHAYDVHKRLSRHLIGTSQHGISQDIFLDRVIVAALLHDAEKVNRYRHSPPDPNKPPRYSAMNRGGKIFKVRGHWEYTPGYGGGYERAIAADLESIKIATECGFPIEDWLINSIVMAAGGYSPLAKEMQPTFEGTILHVADYTSASIFFNHGN